MLAQDAVCSYLLERGLTEASCVVNGDLRVTDASRRNHNFMVITRSGPSYLLKQGVGAEGVATVRHEATVYQALQSLPGGRTVQRYLPRCHGYDEKQHLLVLELLHGSEDLRAYQFRRGAFSTLLAAAAGTALSSLHRCTSRIPAITDGTTFSGRLHGSYSSTARPWMSYGTAAVPISKWSGYCNPYRRCGSRFTSFVATGVPRRSCTTTSSGTTCWSTPDRTPSESHGCRSSTGSSRTSAIPAGTWAPCSATT